MTSVNVTLQEWQGVGPVDTPQLRGLSFEDDEQARQTAAALSQAGRLEILELVKGLHIQAHAHVGRLALGPLQLTIRPKIGGNALLRLFQFAYSLRNLHFLPAAEYGVEELDFQDLLLYQLLSEVKELLARGLHHTYVQRNQWLAKPQGRLDFQRYVRTRGEATAALPCTYYPRLADNLPNRLLLAGLQLGVGLTRDLGLRTDLRQLARQLALTVSPVRITTYLLAQTYQALDRRTAAYEPAVKLIEILFQGQSLGQDVNTSDMHLPGFLFDMNHFFQALVGRFLAEYLPNFTVHEEYRLYKAIAYAPEHNPRNRRPPAPRPDFVIMDGQKIVAVLDSKYRDLWERPLPRDMLYQLAMYAFLQGENATAAIIYPTTSENAQEAHLEIRDFQHGKKKARVVLQPLNLRQLALTLGGDDVKGPVRTAGKERSGASGWAWMYPAGQGTLMMAPPG